LLRIEARAIDEILAPREAGAGREARELEHRGRGGVLVFGEVPAPAPGPRSHHRALIALLGLAQRLLGALARRDVAAGAVVAAEPALLVEDRRAAGGDIGER